jgi:caa(3)-type oxidase subunit IV
MAHHATAHAAAHHGDAHYVRIWALLCALLVVSIVGPMFEIRTITLLTAFGVAIVKAYLVARHFMHLSIEKKWVGYILLVMLAFMAVFIGGTAPDVMVDDGGTWHKTYVEPAPAAGAAH